MACAEQKAGRDCAVHGPVPRLRVEAEAESFELLAWLQDHATTGFAPSWETEFGTVILIAAPSIAFLGSRLDARAGVRFGFSAPEASPVMDAAEATSMMVEALRALPDSEALFAGHFNVSVRRGD
jgi:hypothetical protein